MRGTFKGIGLGESRQRAACRVGVPVQLGHESIRIGESHRVAQAGDECDFDAITVEIPRRIEEMGFEGAALVAERRPTAEIHHTVESPARSNDLDGVHAVRREELAGRAGLHVQVGKPSSRPRAAPETTLPLTEYHRPSSRRA